MNKITVTLENGKLKVRENSNHPEVIARNALAGFDATAKAQEAANANSVVALRAIVQELVSVVDALKVQLKEKR